MHLYSFFHWHNGNIVMRPHTAFVSCLQVSHSYNPRSSRKPLEELRRSLPKHLWNIPTDFPRAHSSQKELSNIISRAFLGPFSWKHIRNSYDYKRRACPVPTHRQKTYENNKADINPQEPQHDCEAHAKELQHDCEKHTHTHLLFSGCRGGKWEGLEQVINK